MAHHRSIRTGLLLVLGLLLLPHMSRGRADTPDYTVQIAPTGDGGLDSALHDSSTLISLASSAPVRGFALLARARADAGRLATALQSFGYYNGKIAITLDGHSLDDPALPDALPRTGTIAAKVTPTTGPLFHLRHIIVAGEVPDAARQALGLHEGDPARAADVVAAQGRLLQALGNAGYALAKVEAPQATLVPQATALDVSFPVQAGPRVDLGPITISGLDRLNESYVRRRLLLHEGEQYNQAAIEAARQDLGGVPAISSVQINAPDALDAQGRLPLHITVSERPRRVVSATAALSTDQGGSVTVSWAHRNLFGNAEQLQLDAGVTGLGGTAEKQPGYNLGATYTIPDWLQRDQSLSFQLLGVREFLKAYQRTAAIANATVRRKLTDHLSVNLGVSVEQAQFVQEGATLDYSLIQSPIGVTWDGTDSLLDPTRGVRANATVTPSGSFAHSGSNAGFVLTVISASTYLDLGERPGRTVLALRGLIGTAGSVNVLSIPPDQRFYAGGSGTIRGYRFQSVGPTFPSGHPMGGTSIDVGSVELRQRIGSSFGVVGFVDGGQVGSNGAPFTGDVRVGAGVGVRYYTSIGPIRFDIAVPLIHQVKSDTLEAYIGIGQAF